MESIVRTVMIVLSGIETETGWGGGGGFGLQLGGELRLGLRLRGWWSEVLRRDRSRLRRGERGGIDHLLHAFCLRGNAFRSEAGGFIGDLTRDGDDPVLCGDVY